MAAGEIVTVEPFLTGRCFVGMVMDCALNLNIWDTLFPDQTEPADVYTNTAAIFAKGLLVDGQPTPSADRSNPGRTS